MRKLLMVMTGEEAVMAKLLYGCGLRVMECMRLRVKDVDLSGGKVEVRGGKSDKDRVLTLPKSVVGALEGQLERCRGFIRTTMIYLQLARAMRGEIGSPLDDL